MMMDPTAAPTGATEMGVLGLFYGGGMSQFCAEFIGMNVTLFHHLVGSFHHRLQDR